jgi:hypothetical protein
MPICSDPSPCVILLALLAHGISALYLAFDNFDILDLSVHVLLLLLGILSIQVQGPKYSKTARNSHQ